jgi:hypothetical protein
MILDVSSASLTLCRHHHTPRLPPFFVSLALLPSVLSMHLTPRSYIRSFYLLLTIPSLEICPPDVTIRDVLLLH